MSRALTNHPSIPPATRDRLKALAKSLGYRPNPLVSALMAYRRSVRKAPQHATLAYITRYPSNPRGRTYARYFSSLFGSAAERARQQGYALEEFSLVSPRLSGARISTILRTRNIQGLVIAPLPESHAHLHLEWEHFCAVAIGASLVEPLLHRAANDYFRTLVMAMHQVAKQGCARPGLALRDRVNERVERRWLAAYQIEQAELPISDRVPPLLARPWRFHAFRRWFLDHRPDAILGTQTKEVAGWLERLGVAVPREVRLVSLDYQPADDVPCGIDQNYPLIAANAVDFVIGMLQRGERGIPNEPTTIMSEGTWVDAMAKSRRRPRGAAARGA